MDEAGGVSSGDRSGGGGRQVPAGRLLLAAGQEVVEFPPAQSAWATRPHKPSKPALGFLTCKVSGNR